VIGHAATIRFAKPALDPRRPALGPSSLTPSLIPHPSSLFTLLSDPPVRQRSWGVRIRTVTDVRGGEKRGLAALRRTGRSWYTRCSYCIPTAFALCPHGCPVDCTPVPVMHYVLLLLLSLASLAAGSLTSLPIPSVAPLLDSAPTVTTAAPSSSEAGAKPLPPDARRSGAGHTDGPLRVRVMPIARAEASTVVYAEGDAGLVLRGTDVSPHLDGRPADPDQVSRVGDGFRVTEAGHLQVEIALRHAAGGPAVDWIWAPRSYYAVSFPSIGLRVTGTGSTAKNADPGPRLQVAHVAPGSPAAHAGIEAGMYVTAVGDVPSATPLDLRAAIEEARSSGSFPLQLHSRVDGPSEHVWLSPARRPSGAIDDPAS